jgi:hypothetical protein
VRSEEGAIVLKFRSDDTIASKGFSASYKFIPSSSENGLVQVEGPNVIRSYAKKGKSCEMNKNRVHEGEKQMLDSYQKPECDICTAVLLVN